PGRLRRRRLLHEVSRPVLLDALAGLEPGDPYHRGGGEGQHRLEEDLRGGEDRRGQELLRRAEHGDDERRRRLSQDPGRLSTATTAIPRAARRTGRSLSRGARAAMPPSVPPPSAAA